jgi:5-methylcytosine-specific restriction enzyme subunit McrC
VTPWAPIALKGESVRHKRALLCCQAENPAGYRYVDLYQLLAYCTALSLPVGHLVYAEGGETRDVVVRHTHIKIRQHALDLGGPVATLLERIAELARDVASPAFLESVTR